MLSFTFGWLASKAFFLTCLRGSHGLRLGNLSHILFYKQWWRYTKKGFKRDLPMFKQWTVYLVRSVFTELVKSSVVCSPSNNPFNSVCVIYSIKYLKIFAFIWDNPLCCEVVKPKVWKCVLFAIWPLTRKVRTPTATKMGNKMLPGMGLDCIMQG